jgi:predicted ATPase/DNA-binding SARP family transcriptional activator
MPYLALSFLGPSLVERDGHAIELPARKAVALLAYLAVTVKPQPRDTLAALFWPDSDQSHARGSLRYMLATLKHAIGEDWIAADRYTIGLDWSQDIRLDVARLRRLPVPTTPPEHLIPTLTEAITRYRGDFLSGLTLEDSETFDAWQRLEAESLRRQLAHALEMLVAAFQAQCQYEQAIEYARRWLALDTWHEPAHYRLIELYALSGQRTAALRHYAECAHDLDEAWGIRPSDETTALYQRIIAGAIKPNPDPNQPTQPHSSARQWSERPPPRPHNLPPQPTAFVGRQAELAECLRYLHDPQRRLLTLIGPGGIGKTRLALQIAQRAVDQALFADGVYFVDLSGVRATDFLVTTIANVLSFSLVGAGEAEKQLLAHLATKHILLILDNFEHLIPCGVGLLSHILQETERVQVLVTSREGVGLVEEWLVEMQGLPYPKTDSAEDAHYDAVALFVQRARQVVADFQLTTGDAERHAMHRICQLVEGQPLGIELAATWVKLLPCTQIAHEIQSNVDFLTTTQRNVPERHRGLRAVFEHSWQLLAPAEQQTLARLAVFRGQFTREAALHVTQTDLRALAGLINKSLLRRTKDGHYTLRVLLRQFAAEKLRADIALEKLVRDRHAEHYAAFVRQEHQRWDSQQEQSACAQIKAEIENVRDGWLWASAQRSEPSVEMYIDCLFDFYTTVSWFQEGKSIFEQAIMALIDAGSLQSHSGKRLLARLYARNARFCYEIGLFDQIQPSLEQSLALLGDAPEDAERAFIYELLGVTAYSQGELQQARELLHIGLDHARKTNNYARIAHILLSCAPVELKLINYDAARQRLHASLALYRRINKQWGEAQALRFLAAVAQAEGDRHQAKELHQHSLVLFQEIDNVLGITLALASLGTLSAELSHDQDAQYYYRSALDLALASQALPLVIQVLLGLAGMLLRRGTQRGALVATLDPATWQQDERAIAFLLLTFILRHPIANYETKRQVRADLAELSAQLPAQLVGELRQHAQSQQLDDLVHTIAMLDL